MAGRLAKKVYNDKRWPIVRRKALDRDKWRCRNCLKPGALEVHHIIPVYVDLSLAFVLSNLLTLCKSCHIAHHMAEKEERRPSDKRIQEAWLDFVNELA